MVSGMAELGVQGTLTLESQSDARSPVKKRRGPPNRMNDLAYRDWMKFQKSFFRYSSDQCLVEECIYFFTKGVWEDGSPSRILVAGFDTFNETTIPAPRLVDHLEDQGSFGDLCEAIHNRTMVGGAYDFVFLDMRNLVRLPGDLDDFVERRSEDLFARLREALVPHRYCGIVVSPSEDGGGGFPFPWAVGLAARSHLRLRDEKIGLMEHEGRVFYCLFMQADADERPRQVVTSRVFRVSSDEDGCEAPAWIIPKPPPRKPHEVLHPAKFPETLIEELIRVHSSEADRVFDPMVGTGSTVLAAMRTNRHGYGTDLSREFIDIAKARIELEREPTLFGGPDPVGRVFVGDATKLSEIRELEGMRFQYAVTSPPYWSMLRNPGSENQRARRKRDLPLVYSDDTRDLGNISDYDQFLDILEGVYRAVAERLTDRGVLTVVMKNVKQKHVLHTLAWDLAHRLCSRDGPFEYAGTTLWCQDDVRIKPFAVGIYWVSNILHTYCVHFRKRQTLSG